MEPLTREEIFLTSVANGKPANLEPKSRWEVLMKKISERGSDTVSKYDFDDMLNESIGITNQIPISTDTDGSVYNKTGFKADTYLSSSSGAVSTKIGYCATGFIPVTNPTILRLKGITSANDNNNRIGFYGEDKSFIGMNNLAGLSSNELWTGKHEYDENGDIILLDLSGAQDYWEDAGTPVSFVRLCFVKIDEDSVITVNQNLSLQDELEDIKKKFLPKAEAVADVTAAPTADDFNALLASLREAGYMES